MSFYPYLNELKAQRAAEKAATGSDQASKIQDVQIALSSLLSAESLTPSAFAALISETSLPFLEDVAVAAQAATLRYFGRTVQLFTPLYLANYCTNRCVYCGFSGLHNIARRKLSPAEVESEAKAIAQTGLRKILALTGDAPAITGAPYLSGCLKILSDYFPSVGIEVPSMQTEEYALMAESGADSMTMFQETYDEEAYANLHPAGPKRDFLFRLNAPERALMGGLRAVNLGPLMGLSDWREDVFYTAMHAKYLAARYPEAEISVSLPRMRSHPAESGAQDASKSELGSHFMPIPVSDSELVQALVALRCFLPQAGITLSTRESAWLRDRLIPLGVTRVSAGVCTAVGGHVEEEKQAGDTAQFDISDERSVDEMVEAIEKLGYQPVFTDWLLIGDGSRAFHT